MRSGVRVTPIVKPLSTPPMVGGVDFKLAILIAVGSVMFALALKILYIPLIGYVLFFAFKQINKEDPKMVNVLQAYTKQGSVYEPFTMFKFRRYDRPNGFGRGII